MRLRRTALPSAFLMLQPNRLKSRPLGRRKMVNSRPGRRRASRYTASYSARRTRRQARGRSSRGASDARETVAPFFAALRKNFSSTRAFHARAEAVLFVARADVGLKGAFWQLDFSSAPWGPGSAACCALQMRIRDPNGTGSLVEHRGRVKKCPARIVALAPQHHYM
jgi:hypothetical protein